MIDPRLEPHHCLYMCKYVDGKWLGCHDDGHEELSRFHTRGEFEESIAYR